MTDIQPILDALRLGVILTQKVQAFGIDAASKTDDSPVTLGDYGVQAILCRTLAQYFPQDAVMGEEGAESFRKYVSAASQTQLAAWLSEILGEPVQIDDILRWLDYGRNVPTDKRTWVIDPIDGTIGFVTGRHYALCIGMMEAYQPRVGAIALPRSPLHAGGSIVYTVGDGVQVMPLGDGETLAGQASTRTDVGGVLVLESVKVYDNPVEMALAGRVRLAAGYGTSPIETYDSQLKYAMISAGYGDVFVRLPRNIQQGPHYIWDHLPGAALMRAGGATLTDLSGNPLDFSQGDSLPHTGFIATNGHIHSAFVRAAKEVLGAEWGL